MIFADTDNQIDPCDACAGSGETPIYADDETADMIATDICPTCAGTGQKTEW